MRSVITTIRSTSAAKRCNTRAISACPEPWIKERGLAQLFGNRLLVDDQEVEIERSRFSKRCENPVSNGLAVLRRVEAFQLMTFFQQLVADSGQRSVERPRGPGAENAEEEVARPGASEVEIS
jgi:hypothetical protein